MGVFSSIPNFLGKFVMREWVHGISKHRMGPLRFRSFLSAPVLWLIVMDEIPRIWDKNGLKLWRSPMTW